MQGTPSLEYVEAERNELETVAASLARTPRLEQLLRYLARMYFEGETDHLTEYNIATEVFGRKKTEFIASQDAIARVETHRLRKKLTAFYENEGKDHPIQISIPLGTYVPNFAERSVPQHHLSGLQIVVDASGSAESDHKVFSSTDPLPQTEVAAPVLTKSGRGALSLVGLMRKSWWYLLLVLTVVVALVGWIRVRSQVAVSDSKAKSPQTSASEPGTFFSHSAQPNAGSPSISLPFRLIAGYTGAPQRDNTGEIWQPDHYFHEGWPRHPSQAFIARTSNPLIYRYGRDGNFDYDIPLAPGVYELHLYFMQNSDSAQSEDAENKAIFNVAINGALALRGFDIVSDAMGRNTGDERVFRDVSPASDGMLHLHFSTVLGTPSLSAVEILTGTPHRQLPIHIVMQPNSYTDHNGQLWLPDDHFLSGRYLPHTISVTSSDPDVLPFERYGHFEYALPVDERDRYTVVLYFVELYFGTPESNVTDDKRLFRVLCNGQTLLDDFDIFKEAGTFHTLKKTFYHLKPTAQGKLNIDFEPVSNYATVSAIEVLDESK